MEVGKENIKKFPAGSIIFEEGDYGHEMYIIRSGEIEIYRSRDTGQTILAKLKHGDFFGEMAVFTGMTRSASARTLTECELQIVTKGTFDQLVKEPVVWRMLQKMSDRIRDFDDKVEDLLVEDQLKKVVQLFRRYVAPTVVDEILKQSDVDKTIDLSGELREVTVLFADIRNFTTIAEKMQPQEVVELLNTYLGEMTHVVFRYDGTVDKYIGDAVMAIFNAPVKQKNHALLAVSAAFNIQKVITDLQKENKEIAVGVGINTGSAILGNIGTELHLDYTVVGDAVNIASRLCREAAPGQLLISEKTYNQVKKSVKIEEMEPQIFKGKTKPVGIYNVIGLTEQIQRPRRKANA